MSFLELLAGFRTEAGNLFFQLITMCAQEMIVIAIICWLYWCSNKKLAYSLAFSYFTSGLLVQGLKIAFRIPRPWVINPEFKAVESAVPGATGYSFPSGHTQSITALFGTFAFYVKNKIAKILCFIVIFLVGFSRMYLGCHTPKDVIVAFVITILCTALCYHFIYKKDFLEGKEKNVLAVMMTICILLIIYACTLCKTETITQEYAADCIKAASAGAAFSIGFYIERTHLRFQSPSSSKDKILLFVSGLTLTLVIHIGLKKLLGISLISSFIRYFFTVLWITVFYPVIFTKFNFFQSTK
ncbi:MAG: phosphatase PAP2 family protein [Clostridia bacterium]|nr:phosphatase PAP2 family protein [Clostridia bacterium]MDY5555260.1 phosphatase PAP2 family protein [Blautia sp.]